MKPSRSALACVFWILLLSVAFGTRLHAEPAPTVRPITSGPNHHFFGYIGHVRTIPWSGDGRYVLALQTGFQERMPAPDDAAEILLLDAHDDYSGRVVDRTRAWNFQQGTMFYWNPRSDKSQFFFNDRDPGTNRVFTVLFDISGKTPGERKREYRFTDGAVANGGVAPTGGKFAAINYGRLARLRPVTGYPAADDWTRGVRHPHDDGVFVVDVETGQKRLLASYKQLAQVLRPSRPDVDEIDLFINHTLWSPDGERLFFFCRGEFEKSRRIDVPFVIRADGSGLTMLKEHIGGHPEWFDGQRMIGRWGRRQGIYDLERQEFVRALGETDTFPDPNGDIALSPGARWLVNGSSSGAENRYTFHRLADGLTLRAGPLDRGQWRSGDLRIDGAPCWNRDGTAVLTTALADDQARTRQMFLITLPSEVAAVPQPPAEAEPSEMSEAELVTAARGKRFAEIELSGFGDGIKHWNDQFGRDRRDRRYDPTQAVDIAENLLAYQNADGGWPKNIDWLLETEPGEIKAVLGQRRLRSTLDNRNTYSQIEYLSHVYKLTGWERYRAAADKGLAWILHEQRPTGGWRGWDVDAITYNDEVMIGVMRMLRRVANGEAPLTWVNAERRSAARMALERAIDATLRCQIVVGDHRTGWCQQHDHTTFEPVKARTYELPAICPAETSSIVQFLMEIDSPAPDVIAAVDGAAQWLKDSKITGIQLRRFKIDPVRFESHTAEWDVEVVPNADAPPLWARFYDIATNRPFFANRDGGKVASLAEVELERRGGYAWYGGWPQQLLASSYPRWRAKVEANQPDR